MELTGIAARGMEQPVREVGKPAPAAPAAPTAGEREQKAAPLYDIYVPEDKSVKRSAGLYRPVRDEDGGRRIEFDPPEDAPEDETEQTTADAGDVDREIEALKRKIGQLERRLDAAGPEESEALERRLAQAEDELRRKDNDAYRRRNAKVS